MTDRLAEQGAVQFAQNAPISTGISRLGGAGALQAAIADAMRDGKVALNGSRLGGKGRIYALAAGAGPMFMFQNSEVGVWYDPSDLTSMFQDSAGTTAAVVGQPVGLMLDKSKGLVLGPELVTNGDFSNGLTGWIGTTTGITSSVVGGIAQITRSGNIDSTLAFRQSFAVEVGKYYKISFSVSNASLARNFVGTDLGPLNVGTGNISCIALASATTIVLNFWPTLDATTSAIDNISVKELPGYHATQSTSTARGVLGTSLVDLDGVDDSYTVATGGGGSTGFFLCAAVRVDGGSGANRVIYSDAGTNTGYILRLNTSNQLELAAGNGTAYTLAATTDTLTAGPYVVTAWDDGTNLNVQVNSGTAGTAARPVVSAGTTTATIGKDNGAATGMFNGGIYPLIYVKNGENVDAADRTAVKTYVAGKAGVSL